jgi:hypothetical protein
VADVYFTALSEGVSPLSLEIENMVDLTYNTIGVPHASDSSIEVIQSPSGQVWFAPQTLETNVGESIELEIHLNSGNQVLGAYAFDIYYDETVVDASAVIEGADGFVTSVNLDEIGLLKFNGFDVSGAGPGNDLHLVDIGFTAIGEGSTSLALDILNLIDLQYNDIGVPTASSASIIVNPGSIVTPTPTPTQTPTPISTAAPTPVPTGNIDPGNPGKMWFVPQSQVVFPGRDFTTELHLNSGQQTLGAYGVDITYFSFAIELNTSIGTNGVEAGPDGFVAAVGLEQNLLRISGFDTSGAGPGQDLHILTINWTAKSSGVSDLIIDIRDLADLQYKTIGTPEGETGHVEIWLE